MGKWYLDTLDDKFIYTCAKCQTELTCLKELVSRAFRSESGVAFLFNSVINVTQGPPDERDLVTGRHVVRDVFCLKCHVKLGWSYDFAFKEQEKYKEQKTILELAKIRQLNWKADAET